MGVLSFLKKPDVEFEVTIPPEMREGMTMGGKLAPRISRSEALQVPAVLRSRNLICSTLAYLPVHIRDKEREIATPTTLIDQIDPDIPNVVTWSDTYEDLLFEGVCWWRVISRNFQGYPTYAEHISTNRVHVSGGTTIPVVDQNSRSFLPTVGRIFIDGQPVADEDVIRFDSPNPPLLVHAARAIRACLQLDQTASNFAANPTPIGAFTPREGMKPREDPKVIEELLSKWESYRRNRVWGYIGGAWELKELQFNADQIQLSEQRQHAVLEIARAAGLDPEDLGVSTTSRTYQNSEERRQERVDFTLRPYASAVEQRLSMGDDTPKGDEVKLNFDGFLRADTKTRYEAHEIALKNGFETINEVRELEERPDLPKNLLPQPMPQQILPAPNGQVTSNAVAR